MADDASYRKGGDDNPEWLNESQSITLEFSEDDDEFRYGPKNNLQYIPKRQEESVRPFLNASFAEILCFFRLYVTTLSKTQMVCVMEQNVNWFFWYRIMNAVFMSISQNFFQIFIAAYVPDEHFYISKISPLMFGYNFVVIIAAFFELMLMVNSIIFLLDYLIQGITMKSPWNRCLGPFYTFIVMKKKYVASCFTLEEFGRKVKEGNANNQTLYFFNRMYLYKNESDVEYFQMSQIIHYRDRIELMKASFEGSIFGIYIIAIWIAAALHNNQLFRKTIWKILSIIHYTEVAIHIVTLMYLYLLDDVLYNYNPSEITQFKSVSKEEPVLIDIDFVALPLNAPPVAHVLFSRYTKDHSQIHYNLYSTILVISNCIYGFLIGFTNQLILRYCEYSLGVKIQYADQNINIFFYFFPIFYSRFYFGNMYLSTLVFCKLLADFYIIVVILQSIIECIVWEWRYATKLIVTATTVLSAVLFCLLFKYNVMVALYMYAKCAVNLGEIYTIFFIYPLGRLIEDMTFHSGSVPNRVRIWNLRFVPIYITYKVYLTITQMKKMAFFRNTQWTWMVPIAVIIIGLIYGIIRVLFMDKRGWTALFCPEPEWGPPDDVLRYCRKMYNMNEYIGSQAERNLSRYMIAKAEMESYRLDVRYDAARRRSSAPASMRYEDEKKYV